MDSSTGRIAAELSFIRPQPTKPSFHSAALGGGEEELFFETEAHEVSIADLRASDFVPNLHDHGFAFLRHRSSVEDFHADQEIEDTYKDEVTSVVRHALGAEEVVVFDVTRRSDSARGASNLDGTRKPAGIAHVDYTKDSGLKRAGDVLGRDRVAEHLARGGRIMQVNVWRPMRGPVLRAPLALADASTIAPDELVATDQIFPDRVGEIYHLAHASQQRWYYASKMQPSELFLIKSWDSATEAGPRFTPHTAFTHPEQTDATPPRESIEVRTFALIEPA